MVRRPILSGLVLSLLPVLALPAAASLFTWTSETLVPDNPVSLAGGDLDGDGDLDLVVCGQPGTVTVLLNDGFGRFGPAPGSPITSIPFPRSAAIGSFNPQQDLFADLVVISGIYEIKTGWLLLGDGTGGFHLQEFFSAGNSDQAAVADFNGDGYDDVVFSSRQVRFGNGSVLIRGTDLPVPLPLPVLAGDFDGDGHPDVGSTHHIFLSVPDTETFVEAPGSPLEFGTNTYTLAAADLDGDDDLDLAVVDMLVVGGPHPVSGVHILLNQGGGRMVHAAFEPVRTEYSSGVAAADFDGDGHTDLAVGSIAEGYEISLLLGDGAGAFTQSDEFLRVAGAGPSSIVAADLDADGKPDLATIDPWSEAVAVFLHKTPPPPILEVSIDVSPGSDDNVIRLGSQGILPVAILSTDHFDATTVDPVSVRLAGAPARLDAQGDPDCKFEDVDRDHRADLLCKVDKPALQLNAGDTVAVLEATTFGATALRGQDTVRVLAGRAPHLPSTTLWWPVGVTP